MLQPSITDCSSLHTVQNDLGEYYAMFNTACPGLLGTPSDFRKQFELPILAGRDAGASDKQIERGSKGRLGVRVGGADAGLQRGKLNRMLPLST